eukprot:GEMP01040790.1.p1 GENE.GEMP01040790.1~~GEMP01040790.1.p1  ORF type:complete len:295 (+),score=68.97 GEMP01040790.1:204-1088(+)
MCSVVPQNASGGKMLYGSELHWKNGFLPGLPKMIPPGADVARGVPLIMRANLAHRSQQASSTPPMAIGTRRQNGNVDIPARRSGGPYLRGGGPVQGPPVPLTVAIPDPPSIEKQKVAYVRMISEQLKQVNQVLDHQMQYQKQFLTTQAKQQKSQFAIGINQQVQHQEMGLSQQYQQQLLQMQAQVQNLKLRLAQQAMMLTLEYEEKRNQEAVMEQQFILQKQQQEMQLKMHRDVAQQCPPSYNPSSNFAPSPPNVPPTVLNFEMQNLREFETRQLAGTNGFGQLPDTTIVYVDE